MGKVIIFSAPSGAGKSTIVKYLLDKNPELEFSISATSRQPRGKEQHGKEYYFFTQDDLKNELLPMNSSNGKKFIPAVSTVPFNRKSSVSGQKGTQFSLMSMSKEVSISNKNSEKMRSPFLYRLLQSNACASG